MATATKKVRAAEPVARGTHQPSGSGALEFLIHQDNGGDYHWEIVAGGGAIVARSAGFASHEDAERAARIVREGAGRARFESGTTEERPPVTT